MFERATKSTKRRRRDGGGVSEQILKDQGNKAAWSGLGKSLFGLKQTF